MGAAPARPRGGRLANHPPPWGPTRSAVPPLARTPGEDRRNLLVEPQAGVELPVVLAVAHVVEADDVTPSSAAELVAPGLQIVRQVDVLVRALPVRRAVDVLRAARVAQARFGHEDSLPLAGLPRADPADRA